MLLYECHGHVTRGGNGYKYSGRKRLTDLVKLYFKNGVKIKLLAVKKKLRNFANRLNYIGINVVFQEGRKYGKRTRDVGEKRAGFASCKPQNPCKRIECNGICFLSQH